MNIVAQSPCRIDIGGTWDMPMFSLLYRKINPVTITISLAYKTEVKLSDYDSGQILIIEGSEIIESDSDNLCFQGKYALVNAILSYFRADGLCVEISKNFPYQSGLGGSGSLAVCLIAALAKLNKFSIPPRSIVKLAHNIEDGLRISYTGYQDQCAAMYGGVMLWDWTNENDSELLPASKYHELEERLVIAYIGKGHDGNIVNQKQVESFLSGSHRKEWVAINDNTHHCAKSLAGMDWAGVKKCITLEHVIRTSIVPERLTGASHTYEKIVHECGGGFGVSGSGGTVFYLAKDAEEADLVRAAWAKIPSSEILDSKISNTGTMIELE